MKSHKGWGLWSCWQKAVLAGCGGFILAGCQTPTQTLSLPLLSRMGGENEIKKLMGWVTKPKAVQGSKTKREIYSLLPISRHFLGSRASVHIAIAWEYKHHNMMSPHSSLYLCFMSITSRTMGYSFGHFSLPASCPLSDWSFWGERIGKTALILCSHCSAAAKTLVSPHYCLTTNAKPSITEGGIKKANCIPARPWKNLNVYIIKEKGEKNYPKKPTK